MKIRVCIFLLSLYSPFVFAGSADATCPKGKENISIAESSSVEVITHYKHSNEYAFEIYFPETYEGLELSTAVVFVGGLENPNLELELKLNRNGDRYSAIFSKTADWEGKLNFQGWYGPSKCVRLNKTYENT